MQVEKEAGNNYIEDQFIHENSRECTLLLEFNEKGFSYSVLKNTSNQILFTSISNVFIS